MTCSQMGGPCEDEIFGNTTEEMIINGAAHMNEMAVNGDEDHKRVQEMMAEMERNPESGKEWKEKFAKEFAALPEN